MQISINREDILTPLLLVGGVIDKKQTLPILSNVMFRVENERLTILATDMEQELRVTVAAAGSGDCEFTIPGKKITEICRALPDGARIEVEIDGEKAKIRSGRSKFSLGVLPARDYPSIEPSATTHRFALDRLVLKELFERTQFAMAQQDVRYYLNGMLLEVDAKTVRTVATDGHRLAVSEAECDLQESENLQILIPRKAVLELYRMLTEEQAKTVEVEAGVNHVRMHLGTMLFTSKLIDGKFPDYQRVIPRSTDKVVLVEREVLRQALQRTSILSNEKYRGINFHLQPQMLRLEAHNPEQEEAEDEVEVEYEGDELSIGFNVGYMLEVLGVIKTERVRIQLANANTSSLISSEESEQSRYVIMPMRL